MKFYSPVYFQTYGLTSEAMNLICYYLHKAKCTQYILVQCLGCVGKGTIFHFKHCFLFLKMDKTGLSSKLVFSCILINQTIVEKLGDIDENSSDHFDFSEVSDTIRD